MKCLLPHCRRQHRARGLCSTHYNQAQRAVQRGETTWPRLEAAGYCLPRRRSDNEFTRWASSQINPRSEIRNPQ